MSNQPNQLLAESLPEIVGEEVYFHDNDNKQYLSGIYKVAALERQDPVTGFVLLQRPHQSVWAKPKQLQLDETYKPIKNQERIVLLRGGAFDFRSVDVASVLFTVANASNKRGKKLTEVQGTERAMELLQQFRANNHITNEGCVLMTYDYWSHNYE